jgi:hypothetical protein
MAAKLELIIPEFQLPTANGTKCDKILILPFSGA